MVNRTPMGAYMGELQEKWQFPSDHLPIGMTFDAIHVISWNVLNAKYMKWIFEKNSQGLSRSLIADEHVYIGDSKLTIRDRHTVQLVLQMITHSAYPRSILSMQECSKAYIEELRLRLPDRFEIISHNERVFLYDRTLFAVVSAKGVSKIFASKPSETVQDITLNRLVRGQRLRFINAHLPGDPSKPAPLEFARYLANTFDPSLTTLCMGDMNFNEVEMSDAMDCAFGGNSPFSLHSPYCTNISPATFRSKAIDHFLLYSKEASFASLSRLDDILPGLSQLSL